MQRKKSKVVPSNRVMNAGTFYVSGRRGPKKRLALAVLLASLAGGVPHLATTASLRMTASSLGVHAARAGGSKVR